ncbi:MAG: hypothetical protein IJR46_07195 [Neisseriaceae bacterium]|nr:hypothetical protein [Neisseriaceae bacterium]
MKFFTFLRKIQNDKFCKGFRLPEYLGDCHALRCKARNDGVFRAQCWA